MDLNEGKIEVFVKDKQVGEIEVAASVYPTEFKKYKCKFKKPLTGKGKLTLRFSQYVNISDVRLV
jgi:hypothetical protein